MFVFALAILLSAGVNIVFLPVSVYRLFRGDTTFAKAQAYSAAATLIQAVEVAFVAATIYGLYRVFF